MTTESRRVAYLRSILSVDPAEDSERMLRMRSRYLASGRLDDEATMMGRTHDELDRALAIESLATIRTEFWNADFWDAGADTLIRQLEGMTGSRYPEVAATAGRLWRVAEARDEFERMAGDQKVDPVFENALRQIVVAPPTTANELRENQFTFLRPDGNPGFRAAGKAIKRAIRRIQEGYPKVYELEKTWFGELFHYKPGWDVPDSVGEAGLGYGFLLLVFVTLIASFTMIKWIFDLGN